MIIVLGSALIPDDRLDEALAMSIAHVHRSREEPGCLSHGVHHDVEERRRLVFVERWADRAAIDAHFRVPESRAFARELTALATEPPLMEVHEVAAT